MSAAIVPLATPAAAASYTIRITCTTPQDFRQLTPSRCLNSTDDPTQTFTATVRNSRGVGIAGVRVQFVERDATAYFRARTRECTTNSAGRCSSELVDNVPRDGEVVGTAARIVSTGADDRGAVRFTDDF